MGGDSDQPLAKSKGVHREVESEGSWRQSSDPRNTNIIRRISHRVRLQNKSKPKSYPDVENVNGAGTWNERESSYRGRSHGQAETEYEAWLK
jgi:hypothetical protein